MGCCLSCCPTETSRRRLLTDSEKVHAAHEKSPPETHKSPTQSSFQWKDGVAGQPNSQLELDLDFRAIKGVHFMCNGGMCSIYKATFKGMPCVVKMPRSDCAQPEVACRDLETEIKILSHIQHPNIIRLMAAGYVSPMDIDGDGREAGDFKDLRDAAKRFAVLEYLDGGTLADMLGVGAQQNEGVVESLRRWHQGWNFPWRRALESAAQLASALRYLHNEAIAGCVIIHRDLKPDNVGFQSNCLKLFDFGLAKCVDASPDEDQVDERYKMTPETGSLRYMSPEVSLQYPYGAAVDVYSFGLVAWEMLCLRRVFEEVGRKDFSATVTKGGRRPRLKEEWSPQLKSLLTSCWAADDDSRPGFREIERELKGMLGEFRSNDDFEDIGEVELTQVAPAQFDTIEKGARDLI
ncbi:unnamed protein product [Chrysoparadoxa australica]